MSRIHILQVHSAVLQFVLSIPYPQGFCLLILLTLHVVFAVELERKAYENKEGENAMGSKQMECSGAGGVLTEEAHGVGAKSQRFFCCEN